jgi:hypothetical protein
MTGGEAGGTVLEPPPSAGRPWRGTRPRPGTRSPATPGGAGRASSLARTAWAPASAGVLVGAWLVAAPRTPDLAAQVYRVRLFAHEGFLLWDNAWYAGHHMPGYSLLLPPLAALAGLRLLGALAVVASAALFGALVRSRYSRGTLPAELFFAVAAAGDAWIGRISFALGVTFALAGSLALARALDAPDGAAPARGPSAAGLRGRALAAVCAAAASASSPVSGLLLVLACASVALAGAPSPAARGGAGSAIARARASLRARLALVAPLAGPALVVAVAMQALFPEGGFEPFAETSLAATLAVTLAFMAALPRGDRLLLGGGAIYLAMTLASALAATPMGSNIARYGVLLAGPLLLCALLAVPRGQRRHGLGAGAGWRASRLPPWALAAVLAGIASWVVWGPVVQTAEVVAEPSTRASFYAPLLRFLAHAQPGPVRIEVPFTRAHWEAAWLAPRVALARGWERQLDKRYNGALESGALDAASYRRWLEREGVSYVALPDVPFDPASAAEVRLLRGGLPYLREVFRDARWRVFRVLGAAPLAEREGGDGSGVRLAALGHDRFTLLAGAPGRYLVRVHFTPYWTVVRGDAQVRSGSEGFTTVIVRRGGSVEVAARFSAGGAWGALGAALRAL